MPIIIPPTVSTTALESHALDGLEFDGDVLQIIEAPNFTPGELHMDWVGGPNADGEVALDEGRTGNIILQYSMRVQRQASTDLALQKLSALIAKLEECRRQRDGLALVWTPAGDGTPYTVYVLSGRLVSLPMDSRGDAIGWLLRYPRFLIELTCKPFVYGDWVTSSTATASAPVVSMVVSDVTGHVPAEGILTVTDGASQSRRLVEWGMESRYLNTSAVILLDSASFDLSGFAGVTDGSLVKSTLATQNQAICGTGNLPHVGRWRVRTRVITTSVDATAPSEVRLRLAYRTGDGPYSYTPWVAPLVPDDFSELVLGTITLAQVTSGAQQWNGRVEAYSPVSGDFLWLDYLLLLPVAEGWGQARTKYIYQSGAIIGRDAFTGVTATTALNAHVAPLGGTWATSGATTDFAADDAPAATDETMMRATTSDSSDGRFARLGSTDYTNVEVGISGYVTSMETVRWGALARWVSAGNYVELVVDSRFMTLQCIVGGSVTGGNTLTDFVVAPQTWYSLRLVVYSSGFAVGALLDANGTVLKQLTIVNTALATGGTLATGRPGYLDFNGVTAATRYYDNFYAATPAVELLAINAGRAIEFRSDSCQRQSAGGSVYGPPQSYTGGRVFVPPAGDAARDTRVWAFARRTDIDAAYSPPAGTTDSLTMALSYRPRYRLPAG